MIARTAFVLVIVALVLVPMTFMWAFGILTLMQWTIETKARCIAVGWAIGVATGWLIRYSFPPKSN